MHKGYLWHVDIMKKRGKVSYETVKQTKSDNGNGFV